MDAAIEKLFCCGPTDEQSARVDVTATANVNNQRQRIPLFTVKEPLWDRKSVKALKEKLQRASAKGMLAKRQALFIRDGACASQQGNTLPLFPGR